MGQKVNPISMRMGVTRPWSSRWYADRNYAALLHEDLMIKRIVKEKLYHAGVSHIDIERAANKCVVDIYSARPGIVIGKRGAGIDTIRADLQRQTSKEISLNIKEVRKAELNAQLVSENIGMQIERRVAFRRVIKRAVQTGIKLGAKGVKARVSGRLGGSEIARAEWYMEGSVPLHTIRANIDYGFAEAKTTYGIIGVKVWIYKVDVEKDHMETVSTDQMVGG